MLKKHKSGSPKSVRNNNEKRGQKNKLTLHKHTTNKNKHKTHKSFATSVARRISPDHKQEYEDIETDNVCAVSGFEKVKSGELNIVLYIVKKTNEQVIIKIV